MILDIPYLQDKILNQQVIENSLVVIKGEPGTGKTTFCFQWMFNLARIRQKSLYIGTVSEPSLKLIFDMSNFTFFDKKLLDCINVVSLEKNIFSDSNKTNLLNTIEELVVGYDPDIIFIDSFKALEDLLRQDELVRKIVYTLSIKSYLENKTVVLVGEYADNHSSVFSIADIIFNMEKTSVANTERRYFSIDKFRGSDFYQGKHPFIITEEGIKVFPRLKSSPYNKEISIRDRLKVGIPTLDKLLGGGLIKGTIALIKGEPGTGKTTFCFKFLTEGAKKGKRGLHISFQESSPLIIEFMENLGMNVREYVDKNILDIKFISPVEVDPDIVSFEIIKLVKEGNYSRVTIDSIFDLVSRVIDPLRMKDLVYSLVHEFRRLGITAIFTKEIVPGHVEDYGISYIADTYIQMKYLASDAEIKRVIGVIKSKGSDIDNHFYEFKIEKGGINILHPINSDINWSIF
ncbi:hypothetical protein KFV02_08080 [Desulfohalobiaceae bacterium Ax17]|uniref:RAD55 family ATPase n=1 Tax=Desulfovulcanus ferrireducens TaxID=2831190 RepID=UPI00207BA099|nr:ATPase domain-containing protein [Desulfovulcanus ferrireducens]MBT8763888.1 hypothetical protein [Desulfovulcanus ferrireducens]